MQIGVYVKEYHNGHKEIILENEKNKISTCIKRSGENCDQCNKNSFTKCSLVSCC